MRLQDIGRYWRTVAPLRAGQVWHRARLTARRSWWSRAPERIDARYGRRATARARDPWSHAGLAAVAALRAARRDPALALAAASDARAGRFSLLGETREFAAPSEGAALAIDWDRPDLLQALLWKTQLHEFPYALDLAIAYRSTGDPAFRLGLFELMRSWTDAEPIGKPGFHQVAWNERVVATRLMSWAIAGSRLGLRSEDADGAWLARALAKHALFLRDNLALDLLGNHLFRDAVALAFAHELLGVCPSGLALVEREVREQILPDGGHVERCPMYHAVCLQDLVELRALLGPRSPAWLDDAVRRAGGFLRSVRLGDGDIALLGDGWRGEVEVTRLLEQAGAAGSLAAPREPERWSGLVCLERGTVRAVVRAGPHGPDYQLGHAHADLLSFEASFGARRVVVDTGTGAYQAGPARERLRSTAAHNTIAIDGAELLEAWSSFRSGRRGRATAQARGETDRCAWLWASHDAYRGLTGAPVPHRLLCVTDDGLLVVDAILGGGRHRIASHLHLHPDLPPDAASIAALGGPAGRRAAPYHERFNQTRELTECFVECEAELPWVGGWLVRLGSVAAPSVSLRIERGAVALRIAGEGAPLELDWNLAGTPSAASVSIRC
jgi:uncharacterized heparinase superfamily protein